MADVFDVAIIGGGLIGTSTALALQRRGLATAVIERDHCGSHSSGINYGGVRRQGRPPAQLPLSQHAHQIWNDLPRHTGIDGEFIASGHLKLARTEADMTALEAYRDSVKGYGLDLELIGPDALRRRYPWIGETIAGASLSHGDGHANPRLIAPAFARAAASAGSRIIENTAVTAIEPTGGGFRLLCGEVTFEAHMVVNAAGAWAARLAAQLDETPPLAVEHPTMLVTEPLAPIFGESIGMQGGGLYGRQAVRGNFVVGGGRGYGTDGIHSRPGLAGIAPVMRRAMAVFPFLEHTRVLRTWSGTEAMTPDHNPIIGPSTTTPGVFHAFGFSGGGFQLAPGVGDCLAELIDTGQTCFELAPLAINRFENGQDITPLASAEDV